MKSLHLGDFNTWADAEAVFITSPHAGAGVSDSRHVGVHLHSTQRVLWCIVIYCKIVTEVTLQIKKKNTHTIQIHDRQLN